MITLLLINKSLINIYEPKKFKLFYLIKKKFCSIFEMLGHEFLYIIIIDNNLVNVYLITYRMYNVFFYYYYRILILESHMVSKKADDGADLYILAGHEASY